MRDFNVNGEIVGRPYQAVNEQSLIQKYPIGMKYENWGKIWRYSHAVAAIAVAKRCAFNLATSPWTGADDSYSIGSGGGGAGTITGAAGDNKVLIVTAAHLHTLDEFQGGILNAFPADTSNQVWQFRVIGNDLGYDTTHFWAYIDPPLPIAMATVPIDMQPSPYMNCADDGTTSTTVVCVPELIITSGYYFWGQTRGPCYVSGYGDTTVNQRTIGASIPGGGSMAYATIGKQCIGWIIAANASDDDSTIMLMLE